MTLNANISIWYSDYPMGMQYYCNVRPLLCMAANSDRCDLGYILNSVSCPMPRRIYA